MSVTREQIDQALAAIEWPVFDDHYPIIQAARLGRILAPSQCQTCGGSGKTPYFRQPPTDPCPSCGGSGKEWQSPVERIWYCEYPEFGDEACMVKHDPANSWQPRKHTDCGWALLIPLDALAALAEEEE